MKKLTAILLTLFVCATVIGCNDTATTKKETKTTEKTSTTAPKTP